MKLLIVFARLLPFAAVEFLALYWSVALTVGFFTTFFLRGFTVLPAVCLMPFCNVGCFFIVFPMYEGDFVKLK